MALAGALLIWIVKSLGAGPLITVAIPLTFIITYCALASQTEYFRIRDDQVGDNAYYLGFLFTLSSLAYALWHFQSNKGGDPADIISSFGVALWSTIVGVALRVYFAQVRQDPDDIERESRAKLAQAASLLASDLYQASATFNTYVRSLQQSVDEAFTHSKNLSTQAAESFAEITKKTNETFADLNKKFAKIEAPDSIINKKIDSLFNNIEDATAKLARVSDSQGTTVNALNGQYVELGQGIEKLTTQFTSLRQTAANLEPDLASANAISNTIDNLQQSLKSLAASFAELELKQNTVARNMTDHADALVHQLSRSRQYTDDVHASIASMTKTLAEKVQ